MPPHKFFAFIFAALVALEVTLMGEIPQLWLRMIMEALAFVGTFYVVMLNARVRNWLVAMLGRIKELESY